MNKARLIRILALPLSLLVAAVAWLRGFGWHWPPDELN